MFKSLVFVSFLAVALASPIDSGYVSTIEEMFNPENESAVCKEESEKFKQCFEVLKELWNALRGHCKNEVDSLHHGDCPYAMEQIFGEGYSCLNEQNLKAGLVFCIHSEARMEEVQAGGIEALASKMKPIAKCITQLQECEDKEKNAFYKGAMALADFAEVAMKVAHGVQTEQLGYIETFDKKFNRADFDNLELILDTHKNYSRLIITIDSGNLKTIEIPKPQDTSSNKVTVGWISVDYHSFPIVFPIRIVEQPQELESLECKICVRQYNETDRIPRVIPVCGHTLCEDCARNIISGNTLKCPVDRRDVNVEGGASSLPRNFAILETIEERNTLLNVPMGPIDSEPTYPRIPCAENFRHESTVRCVVCEANYCESCFNKNHQGRVLSAHETIDITFPKCTNCPDKFAEVVCTQADCSSDHSPICLHCYGESHKKHRYETIRKNLEQNQIVLDNILGALAQKLRELEMIPHNLSIEEQEDLEYLKNMRTFGIQMKQCDYKKHKRGKSFAWWFQDATKLCFKKYGYYVVDIASKNVASETEDIPVPAGRASLTRPSNIEIASETIHSEETLPIDSPTPESVRSSLIFGAEVLDEVLSNLPPDSESWQIDGDGSEDTPEISHRRIDSPVPESVRSSMIFPASETHEEKLVVETPILLSSSSVASSTTTEKAIEPEEQRSGEPSGLVPRETNDSSPNQGVRSRIDHLNKIRQLPIGNKNYIKTKIAASLSAQDCGESTINYSVETAAAQNSETSDFSENVDSDPFTETEHGELGTHVSKSSDNLEDLPIASQLLEEPGFSPSENLSTSPGMVQEPSPESQKLLSTQQPAAVKTKETGIKNQTEALNSTPVEDPDTEENFKFKNIFARFEKATQSDNGTILNVPRPIMRAKFLVDADLAKPQETSDSKSPDFDVNPDISKTSTSSSPPQPAPRTKLIQTKLVSTRVAMFNNFDRF
ncbi:hypothetical protein CRE_03516 [Caenorhabditis remanei]|uniref:RING-type domain-containing protein n=1 Tax=Caenorhabditis remanei TaxID=31234 RepID=E3NLH7_CAERE|nr:hypothetical protein CRE_03516 [Caenorhabditis remanei]